MDANGQVLSTTNCFLVIFDSFTRAKWIPPFREDMQHALNILPQGGEYIMNTLAEEWQKEGELRGELRGIIIGEQKSELKTVRQLLLVTLQDRFDLLPQFVINDIKSIESPETLNELFRKTLRCESLDQFKGWLNKVLGRTTH
jgi:hypothetical protein